MVIKTLIVDDNKLFLKKINDHLEEYSNIESITALSSKKGLDILDNQHIDVIVADYLMPEMDGLEFLEKIREERGEDIPFIMFTGKGGEEIAEKALNLEADRYIRKDDDTESKFSILAKAIEQEFGRWKAEKKLEENERKLKQLYEMAPKIEKIEDPQKLYGLMIETANDILEFDVCSVEIEKDEKLVVRASTEKELIDDHSMSIHEGIAGKTFRNKKPYLSNDVKQENEAKPTDSDFRSAISVPMGDLGVFQALSYEENYYDEEDLELAELFVSYMTEAIKRINSSKALKESVERFRTILESSADAIFLTDQEGNYTYANQAALDLLSYSKEEITDMELGDLSTDENREKKREMFKKLLEKGELFTETTLVKKNGEEVPVELNAVSLPNGMIYGSCRDISERKKEKEAVNECKEKFKELCERCAELQGYETLDEIHTFAVETGEEILGFEICEIVIPENQKMVSVVRSKDYSEDVFPEQRTSSMDESIAGKTYQQHKSLFVDFDKLSDDLKLEIPKDKFTSVISVPIENYGVFQAFSTEEDELSEYDLSLAKILVKHISKALRRIQKRNRDDFFSSLLSDYVSNKINMIRENILSVKKDIGAKKSSEELKNVEDAVEEIENVREKIGTLKEFDEEDTMGSVNISWILKPVILEYEKKLERKGIELESEINGIEVQGGPLLKEVFSNLLENSMRHSEGNKVLLSMEEEKEEVIVKVEDDGKGISDEIKDKIFDQGFKKGRKGGAGLGLFLVKKIIDNYGGSVSVEDSNLGGVLFEVRMKKVDR